MQAPSPTSRRALRPYLPVGAAAIAFLVMAAIVGPTPRDVQALAGNVDVPLASGNPAAGAGNVAGGGPSSTGEGGTGGSADEGGAAGGTAAGGTGGGSSSTAGGDGGDDVGGGGGVVPCPDRDAQVPGDPYSPPCLAFAGDNGGATATGVTADEIIVSVRRLEGPTAAEIFSSISGQSVEDSPESYVNTLDALGEYFSTRFQFYGRELRFEIFDGEGSGSSELLGSGREAALADAVRAREIGAFADLSAITLPYADAIANQGIIGYGAPYPSRSWFEARRPFAWSLFPDGTRVTEASAAATIARLDGGGPGTADFAGGNLKGKPRVFGLVAPENADYQESVDLYTSKLAEAGLQFKKSLRYKLDISSMPNQASNIVAQLKNEGVTTVVCACDPVMLALGMAPKANEQGWEPEWRTSGLAFVEQDMVAQLIDDRQWQHAYGISFNAESEPIGASFPYAAFKQIRPGDEPAFGVEELYYQMYMLALGIHLAGPNLTPETLEAGMFSYQGAMGPRGYWGFGPGDYTPTDDFREIWWDPDRISSQNNRPGSWVQVGGGQRWFADTIPSGPGSFFQEG